MKFRKRAIVIEAVPWSPDERGRQTPPWPRSFKKARGFYVDVISLHLLIPTLEGVMRARPGDWIIRGVQGEFYPCQREIFKACYEAMDEN